MSKATLIKLIDKADVIQAHYVEGTHILYLVRHCPHTSTNYAIVSEYPPTGTIRIIESEDDFDKAVDLFTSVCVSCDNAMASYHNIIDTIYKHYGIDRDLGQAGVYPEGRQDSQRRGKGEEYDV